MNIDDLQKIPPERFKAAVIAALKASGTSDWDSPEFGWEVRDNLQDPIPPSPQPPSDLE